METSEWIILELNEIGDSSSYKEMENAVFELFGETCEYFIPIHYEEMGSYVSTSILFQGYVFVKKNPDILEKLPNIHDSRLFSKALRSGDRLQTVDARTIGVLKRKLQKTTKKKLEAGTKVKILEGIFKNLVGEVVSVEDEGKKVLVKISRLSREMIAPVPSTSIEVHMGAF